MHKCDATYALINNLIIREWRVVSGTGDAIRLFRLISVHLF